MLQVHAALTLMSKGKKVRTNAVLSVLCSAASAAYATATVSFDMDIDPSKRKANPGLYGYIRDRAKARLGIYAAMIAAGMLLLLVKSTGVAMLIMMDPRAYAGYYGAEMAIYVIYKVS